MKQLIRNLRLVFAIFFIVFIALLAGIVWNQHRARSAFWGHAGENKLALKEQYAKAGKILARDGTILAASDGVQRYYAEDHLLAGSLVQLIGDYTHNIANTVEERYAGILTGTGRGVISELIYDFTGHGNEGSDLRLSLDPVLCRKAAELLSPYQASLVLLNYESGEILSMVNLPAVDPQAVIDWSEIPEGALFNKAILAKYSPGSTFKLVTEAAWLNSANFSEEYTVQCKGLEPLLGPGSVNEDRADAGHGLIGRQQALASSCNHFFGAVSLEVGADSLASMAEKFGFGSSVKIGEIQGERNLLEWPQNVDDFLLTWLAIGQPLEGSRLTTNPLHLAMISASIANQGKMMNPILVTEQSDPLGRASRLHSEEVFSEVLDADTAEYLQADMEYSARAGLAASANIQGERVGAKTGTAQYSTDTGIIQSNSLFTGYLINEEHPLAIGIVIEDQIVDISAIAREMMLEAMQVSE